MITLDLLKLLCPNTKEDVIKKYIHPLIDTTQHYEINCIKRVSGFLAQIVHESNGLKAIVENLNYSSKGLMSTFKKYFPTEELANQYARQPEKIANRVYANRMMNNDENSGDGWKYRGRGLIQLTGKFNYTLLSQDLDMTLDETVNYLETQCGATMSAGWFWDRNKLNRFCDNDDFVMLTKKINGGTIGLPHRIELYEKSLKYLEENK